MTYQSDPNTNRRCDKSDDAYCKSCIIGGGVVLASVVFGRRVLNTGNSRDHNLPNERKLFLLRRLQRPARIRPAESDQPAF